MRDQDLLYSITANNNKRKQIHKGAAVTGLVGGGAFGPMLCGTGPCIGPAMGTLCAVTGPRASIALGSRPAERAKTNLCES